MPTYRTTETHYSKRRRYNDNYGTGRKGTNFLKWNFISDITSENLIVTWSSVGISVVDIYISYDGGSEFSELVLQYPNTGNYEFVGDEGNYPDVVLKLVGNGLVDISNNFSYLIIAPVSLMWIGFSITPPVEPNNSLMWIGEYIPILPPTITKVDNTIVMI